MKNIKLPFFQLFIIISLALSPSSFAERVVRLNLQEGLDAQGNQMPIDPRLSDILRMIEQESTLKFTPILLPWKRAQQETLNGNGIILGLTKTEERELIFQFSDVLGSLKVWAFTYGLGTSSILNANDLQGKKVCVARGVSHGAEFENAKINIFKVQDGSASTSARFRQLIAQRCDAVLLPVRKLSKRSDVLEFINSKFSDELDSQPQQNGYLIPSIQPIFLESIHFASAKGHYNDVLEEINGTMFKLKRNKEFKRLLANYY